MSKLLIVISGLSGSGKSTLAEHLSAKLLFPVFSVDPIEAAIRSTGIASTESGIAAYEIACTLADEQLKLGISPIIDAVNPVETPRAMWRKLAAKHSANLVIIEVMCSDIEVHKQRVENRVRNLHGIPEVTWERVQERQKEYQPWEDEHLALDSIQSPEKLTESALTYIKQQS